MIANRIAGRIINIWTMKTARTYVGMPHYDASKGGLNALTKLGRHWNTRRSASP